MEELVFLFHLNNAFQIDKCKSEFDRMQILYRSTNTKAIEEKFLQQWSKDGGNRSEMTQESNRLRLEGNKFFKTKKEKRNLLAACRLYTEAIFAAPVGSQALALAHANRSFALLEFGYIQQAYDDCVCAREHGYPEHLMDKILLRQADCAQKLGDVELLKLHLDELNALPLNEAFIIKSSELQANLEELLKRKEENTSNVEVDMSLNRESQKIVESSGNNDRYMIASQTIKEGELIFRERSFCFVPAEGRRICHECAVTQLIPFPCMHCRKVVYCSLKCRGTHAAIHEFECAAYQWNVLGAASELNVAFCMVVKGLPQLVPLLSHLSSAKALWTKLMDGSIVQTETLEYAQILRGAASLENMQLKGFKALWCYASAFFLKKFTSFYNCVKITAASQSDWQMITAALLLRHSCQVRGFEKYYSLTLAGSDPLKFSLFKDHIWSQAFRVQRGCLYNLTKLSDVARASFPYTSLATHSCVPALQSKLSGPYIHTFAAKNIKPGEMISRCYTVHHKNRKFSDRCTFLKDHYNLVCKCVKCKRQNPDKDYAKYHRYRCESLKCRLIFIQMPENDDDVWWIAATKGYPVTLKCNICGVMQTCAWYKRFLNSLALAQEPSERRLMFRNFNGLTDWLVELNEVKLYLANQMIGFCFDANSAGFTLTNAEFDMLADVVKYLLSFTADQEGFNSIHYASKLPFLWDLIALGKYKCSNNEMQDMLKEIEILPDEFKVIFMNYYEDYVKPLLSL